MLFSYECLKEEGGTSAKITGVSDAARILRVPSELEGHPVRYIAPHAFEKNDVIEQIILPDSVRGIGTFAFYGCRKLQSISLSDNTESWGTGAIYFSGKLKEISLRITQGRYTVLKDILADTDLGVYVKILHEGGDAELYFPAFTHGFDEDTYARAFHTWIEGCGFAYRETVLRNAIDYRGYDQLFERAVADGVGGVRNAANIALSRLMCPFRVSSRSREAYENYLTRHGEEILMRLVRENDRERAMFLLDSGSVSAEGVREAVNLASENGDAELVGMLMRRRKDELGGSGTGKMRSDTFELDDL